MQRLLLIILLLPTGLCRQGYAQIGRPAGFTESALGSPTPATVQVATVACIPLSACSLALPLQLLEFRGEKAGKADRLYWTTGEEENMNYYEIQRSGDALQFDSIGTTVSVNSKNRYQYSFPDASPLTGKNFYRLQMVDRDGKFTQSKVILLQWDAHPRLNIFPNPVSAMLTISLFSSVPGENTYLVTDMTGRLMMQARSPVIAGYNNYSMNVGRLANGTYLLTALSPGGGGTAQHVSFMVVH